MACGRGDLQEQPPSRLYTNYKVCAHHFEEKMYTNKLKNRLLPSAIPTLFPQMEGCSREPKGEKREADDDINEREIMAQLMSGNSDNAAIFIILLSTEQCNLNK